MLVQCSTFLFCALSLVCVCSLFFVIDLVFLSSIILKRRTPTHIKKGNTNDEHTHRRNNKTPNQAPTIQNEEHNQQQRTWNQTQERTRTTLNVFFIIVLVLCFCYASRNCVFDFDRVLCSCCWYAVRCSGFLCLPLVCCCSLFFVLDLFIRWQTKSTNNEQKQGH
jgi:hypothetical protein